MKSYSPVFIPFLAAVLLGACGGDKNAADAYGHFEAREVVISAESNGVLERFDIEEGAPLAQGAVVGWIDTTAVHLRRVQLDAQIAAVRARRPSIQAQVRVLDEQRQTAADELARFRRLLGQGAATAKQVDDMDAQLRLTERQREAQQTQFAGLDAEIRALQAQQATIDDQIKRSVIVNPISGTVLRRYAEAKELAAAGKPLYSIAAVDTLDLRVYVGAADLAKVRLGAAARVTFDGVGGLQSVYGTVSRVADQAEFTPKVIQTRAERTALVYAVLLRVPNDGRLKIGMPGEVVFDETGREPS